MKNTTDESKIPTQELTKYNRESGKKTLRFVGVLITTVVALIVLTLIKIL